MSEKWKMPKGYDMFNVADGSVLWKLHRGYNERRSLLGLSPVRYEGNTLSEVAGINNAIIVPGADMQNAALWRLYQSLPFTRFLLPPSTSATTYNGLASSRFRALFSGDFSTGEYATYNFRRVAGDQPHSGLYGQMEAGDIIGPWIIEDIVARFSVLKWTEWSFGSYSWQSRTQAISNESCAEADSRARSEFWGDAPGTGSGTFRTTLMFGHALSASPGVYQHRPEYFIPTTTQAGVFFAQPAPSYGELLAITYSGNAISGSASLGPFASYAAGNTLHRLQSVSGSSLAAGAFTIDAGSLFGVSASDYPADVFSISCPNAGLAKWQASLTVALMNGFEDLTIE